MVTGQVYFVVEYLLSKCALQLKSWSKLGMTNLVVNLKGYF